MISALIGLAMAVPRPQEMDFEEMDASGADPSYRFN